MENNPYQTPKSNIEIEVEFKRSVWWKIYFFFITAMSALGMLSLFADPKAGISEYFSILFFLAETVGLFGFVFLKKIYKPKFWLQLLIASIIFAVAYSFITDVDLRKGISDTVFYISSAIGWLLSLPAYYGLYAYSKPTNPIWGNT